MVPELKDVPLKYTHESSKMPHSLQEKIKVFIGASTVVDSTGIKTCSLNSTKTIITSLSQIQSTRTTLKHDELQQQLYPRPMLNERENAKIAKDKVSDVRNYFC